MTLTSYRGCFPLDLEPARPKSDSYTFKLTTFVDSWLPVWLPPIALPLLIIYKALPL